MKIDRPVRKKHNNMQLNDHEVAQLIVFDELINESTTYNTKVKTVQKKIVNPDGSKGDFAPFEVTKVKVSKNVSDYNKFKKAKKTYVKELEKKYALQSK